MYNLSQEYKIYVYTDNRGKMPYDVWFNTLENTSKYRIETRLDRLEKGNFGNCKNLGEGLLELKFTFGGGIRIYFSLLSNNKIILLSGGNKSRQNKDIKLSRKYLSDYHHD